MYFKGGIYHCKLCVFKTISRGACSGHLFKECSLVVGCDVCSKVFAGKKYLKRHQDRVFCKPVLASNECKNCLSTFTNNSNLRQHMKRSVCNKVAAKLRKVPKSRNFFDHEEV
uniref:(northern house mosquito) hypothetical protein n=1 Tax=Culex pipiens TaxID=7175 RepID=A0A8D8BES1_CULPI